MWVLAVLLGVRPSHSRLWGCLHAWGLLPAHAACAEEGTVLPCCSFPPAGRGAQPTPAWPCGAPGWAPRAQHPAWPRLRPEGPGQAVQEAGQDQEQGREHGLAQSWGKKRNLLFPGLSCSLRRNIWEPGPAARKSGLTVTWTQRDESS